LERRTQKRSPQLLLDKPILFLNPWARRTTTTGTADARGGGGFARSADMPAPSGSYAAQAIGRAGAGDEAAFAGYDFLPDATPVLANLALDDGGTVVIPRAALGTATEVTLIVDDPTGVAIRRAALDEQPLAPRDLRLRLALDPARHAKQNKVIAPLRRGDRLTIEDLATAKLHLIDTIEKAHAYLLALADHAALREWSWIVRWHALPDGERRERYSKYACHELHLFLWFKDRAFFDDVVRPYLAHKRTKTFLDHWLLGDDVTPFLEPARLATLNAVERALLAHRLPPGDALARVLGDQVAIIPPDPELDTRLIDTLIGAAALDRDAAIGALQGAAVAAAEVQVEEEMYAATRSAVAAGPGAPRARMAEAKEKADKPLAKKLARREARKAAKAADESADFDDDALLSDLDAREEAAPLYRPVDRTQEWAEHNWWRRTPAESGADMIAPNRLWRDLAASPRALLSGALGLATHSFAEAMCALAVTDLPFVAAPHEIAADGPRLEITAGGDALAGTSQLVYGDLDPAGLPIVVGMSYVRADDRYDWSTGEQVEKYLEGALATGVVYTCQVVIANPTSSRQRVAALVQIPRGSMPVAGARQTHTLDIVLEAYGTHGHEYSFYFPSPGRWSHFPVHVSRGDVTVAAAPGRTLEVTAGGAAPDPRSWAHVSQRGSVADVVAYLATSNLAAIDLSRVAWRLRDRGAYDAILGRLEQRRVYDATLWGYALLHRDGPRIRTYLRALGAGLLAAGPVLDMLGLDAEDLGAYEHLEYAPLVNARAHRLGARLRILNDGLAAQYARFLDLVAHRRRPTSEDLLAAAAYFLAQDRPGDAAAALARVHPSEIADRLQHDYLAAYVACLAGDTGRAFALASRWRDHPVDRWRHRFGALLAMLDEVRGAAAVIVDPRSREQQHAGLAAVQPAFELAVDRDGVVVTSQHVAALELRYFEMDVELLFSRQPFVQSDVSRFSFIEPGHREQLGELPPEHRVPWPAQLRGKNVVVEAVGAGQRKAKVHYANDLATTVGSTVGQVRVARASDRTALPATYVKVYARKRGGAVAFYKDGYTDLRGWFDYASLSTTDLDQVERFAILVCSDTAGASILEAHPPVR
ncbi:MAG: hypothetical protein KIT31_39895, partial [Deltaproteobacteria bacterium]|nr:hypothetical protein [Deltaproteobacteria bacterium]